MILRYIFALLLSVSFTSPQALAGACPEFLNLELKKLHSGKTLNICKAYAGKPLLIVNTACYCGYTPQFKVLETIHQTYKDKGLVVLGFASNDFDQEAKDEKEIANVCFINYGVTFDMFAPIKVTGEGAHPLFMALAGQSTQPAWNFNKYLVSAEGKVVKYFNSAVTVDSVAIKQAIEQTLTR